jgi:hypothetical protein
MRDFYAFDAWSQAKFRLRGPAKAGGISGSLNLKAAVETAKDKQAAECPRMGQSAAFLDTQAMTGPALPHGIPGPDGLPTG